MNRKPGHKTPIRNFKLNEREPKKKEKIGKNKQKSLKPDELIAIVQAKAPIAPHCHVTQIGATTTWEYNKNNTLHV